MDIEYWASTDVGRKRTHNEDNYLIDKDLRLFVVADGMGGHASGEVASAIAVHTIRDIVSSERDLITSVLDDDPGSHMEVCTLLEYAVHIACETIFEKAKQEPEKRGMGTTVVALLLIGARGYIAYVGDSRIYLLRGGIVYQLTEDHSLMNELVRRGKIRADEFDDSPYANFKNAMTRAVGPHEVVEVDTLDFDMVPGDNYLLCSDGLYEYLEDEDIARRLALPDVQDVARQFVDLANTRGGKDNITALVIRLPEDETSGDRAAEVNFTLDTLKKIPLFTQLSYQQLVRVMNLARIKPVKEGEVLCKQGESGQELFVILRGSVRLESGGTTIITLPQGAHLGEMALIDSVPRSVTAIAAEDGKVLSISRTDFYEILKKEAPLAVKLLWSFLGVLSDRLRQTTADLKTARDEAGMEDLSEELSPDLFEA
jgi:serine/threonine protein phosphatase PrpC